MIYRSYLFTFANPAFQGARKATGVMLIAIYILELMRICLELIGLKSFAIRCMNIIANLDSVHQMIFKKKLQTTLSTIKRATFLSNAMCMYTVITPLVPLINKREFWFICLKAAAMFASFSSIRSMLVLYWAFCHSTIFHMQHFVQKLHIVKSTAEIESLRIAFWKLQQVVEDINYAFGSMILFWLVTCNVYIQIDLYDLAQKIILHVFLGEELAESTLFGMWAVLDFIDIFLIIYPAIKINYQVHENTAELVFVHTGLLKGCMLMHGFGVILLNSIPQTIRIII